MEDTRKDNTSPRAGGEGSHLPQEAEGLSISGPQMKLSWPQSLKCLLTTAPGDDYSFYCMPMSERLILKMVPAGRDGEKSSSQF